MFFLATVIGLYSYIIFYLGIFGFLYKNYIILGSFLFILPTFYLCGKQPIKFFFSLTRITGKKDKIFFFILSVIVLQAIINSIGVLGPELAFDALWYHLTLPKIYLLNHTIDYIPGGLLYYSVMPKLTEMLYIPVLAFGSEIHAKLIHFMFGILSAVVTYRIARLFLSRRFSLLAGVIFYSNLVVGWESITAYVDLTRTFYESLAFLGFLWWMKTKKGIWFFLFAVMLGFASTVKLLSILSILIFLPIILFYFGKKSFFLIPLFAFIAFIIPLPWFIFSYINTGNPVYPFFTSIYPISILSSLNPFHFFNDILKLLVNSPDKLSPLYIIFLPFSFLLFKRFSRNQKIFIFYSFLAFLVWFVTPRTGGGRFVLPYLPALSVLVVLIINKLINKQNYLFIFFLVISSIAFPVLYRGIANAKYVPVILGYETKQQFLTNHLNFSFGDFYDTDGFFKKNIRKDDRVLLYGFHNLYYVEFPFVDSSWVKKGDAFNFVAVQNGKVPLRFADWDMIYENKKTKVKLYTSNKKVWQY